MPLRFDVDHTVVPLSGSVTGIVNIANAVQVAVVIPVITSGMIFVQGAFSADLSSAPASADMLRVFDVSSQAAFFQNVAAGSLCLPITAAVRGLSHIRIETENPQAAIRSLAILTKS